MVIDVITFCGEAELFDIRYNILKDFVDKFIVVEFDKTFTGKDKPFYFEQLLGKYEKIQYHKCIESVWHKYLEIAIASPNTKGAGHWIEEFCQKEFIKDCLDLKDDDLVYIGDCDEIWQPIETQDGVNKLKLRVYTYFLNNLSSEQFWGTIVGRYGDIKDKCLNHLRTNAKKTYEYCGWHFTSMAKSLKQKLQDSYTDEDYATDEILNAVDNNVLNDRDFLGRDFKFKVDESEWPDYLKKNRQKYSNMLK